MISKLIIPKDQLICIPENLNSQDALTILEDQQLRCAPVVDESTNLFRGNIYRYHFYYELYQQSLDNLSEIPVTRFLKNTTRVVHETDSFYHLLFTIRDLPHIAVLNEQNSFLGIIKHRTMLDFYSQA